MNAFAPDNILIAIGSVNNEPRAGAILPIYGDTAYYHHGASIPTKEPVPHLLQWRIIEELKRRGIARYNFWGIAPNDNPKHPWHGLSLFKQGFGGYRTDYLHAQDYIISPLRYWPTAVIERTRRWWRGL
jgi:lipid II:glycine glycyltransferase (peptidoglycan interpeptide bridge formation enzyme)